MKEFTGAGASPGIAAAPVNIIGHERPKVSSPDDPTSALAEATAAVAAELTELGSKASKRGQGEAAGVLEAQSLMAQDPMIVDTVMENLEAGASFDDALNQTSDHLTEMFRAIPDPYLAARADDVGEVIDRICWRLSGEPMPNAVSLTEPAILCARLLTAAETALLDPDLVAGFATEEGGPTSHVSIIARSMGVPAVVGVAGLMDGAESGLNAVLDGSTGEVVFDPDEDTVAEFRGRARREEQARLSMQKYRGVEVSFGDQPMAVSANVGNASDVERAVAQGADGIGLMRTEFLYMDRLEPPTEDEQVEIYVGALSSFHHTVTIRTFDIGGDKPAKFMNMEAEENPFLGIRGVRTYGAYPKLLRTQMRALLRASVHGKLAIMVPMIATPAEASEVKAILEELVVELADEGHEVGSYEYGVMIEVPSAALLAEQMAPIVDFFSIGTNDLTQYTMAADRMNTALEHLHDPLHPAVLSLCRMTAEVGQRHGKSVSVCGLAAADPLAASLFAEMGIDKLSVAAPSVNLIKSTVAELNVDEVRSAAVELRAAGDVEEIRRSTLNTLLDS